MAEALATWKGDSTPVALGVSTGISTSARSSAVNSFDSCRLACSSDKVRSFHWLNGLDDHRRHIPKLNRRTRIVPQAQIRARTQVSSSSLSESSVAGGDGDETV